MKIINRKLGRLAEYKDIHRGQTIIVCGCGVSLKTLTEPDKYITIGVNDVGRLFDPTYLVVLNGKHQFKNDRFRYVESSKASAIFSQLKLQINHHNIVQFRLGMKGGTKITDDNAMPYTKNSPYVAVCLAEYMGASRIALLGVDFTEDHFFASTGKHVLASQLDKIDKEYSILSTALAGRGVELVNLSSRSRLTSLRKVSLDELFDSEHINIHDGSAHIDCNNMDVETVNKESLMGFTVVHVSKTNCAGSIWNLSKALNQYTGINSRVITGSNITSGLSYPKDVLLSEKIKVRQLLKQADLIHFHNNLDKDSFELQPYRNILRSKPAVLQFHSEPHVLACYFSGRCFVSRNDMDTLAVAQKHTRFYPQSIPVPNIIDIYSPELMPVKHKNKNVLTVMYCPTDKKSYKDYTNTCCGKGYIDTLNILKDLKLKGIIEYLIPEKTPWSQLMQLRTEVDVLIDECVTGGYHMTSLEGLSQGLVTIAYLDELMVNQLCKLTGSQPDELPWINTKITDLRDQIIYLAENQSCVKGIKEKSRIWMEKYWSPDQTLAHYLKVYYQYGIKREKQSIIKELPKHDKLPVHGCQNNKNHVKQNKYTIAGKQGGCSESYPQTVSLHDNLLAMKKDRHNENCHILGNGPSIANIDLSLLYSETVIGVNASPLLHEQLGRVTDYYCISDRRFFERENINQILKLSEQSTRVFAGYCSGFVEDKDINYVKICGGDGISEDIHDGFYHGCSAVYFASQLAMWLGFKNIYLYGCEFNYNNGRFYDEARPMPFDKNTYPRIVRNFKLLKKSLSSRGGRLNVVGPSRLVGDFGSIPLIGVRKLSQAYVSKRLAP